MITLFADNHAREFLGDFPAYQPKNPDDLLILLGDTCFHLADRPEYRSFDEWFLSRPYQMAFLDGNHEDFAYLDSFPEEDWHGGRVNRLNDRLVRLRRGEIYELEGKSFFVFGGCASGKKWKEQGLWHPGDMPTQAEVDAGKENLKRHGLKVDYLLTHKYYCSQCFCVPGDEEYPLYEMSKWIDKNVSFTRWYSGHRHEERAIDDKHVVIFNHLTEVPIHADQP